MPSIRFWSMYQAIGRLEAQEDMRALSVAVYGANPGKDGQGVRSFAAQLEAQVKGQKQEHAGAYGMPFSALKGPNIRHVEAGQVSGYRARLAEQVEEQKRAWETGKWPALAEVLAKQQADNRAAE